MICFLDMDGVIADFVGGACSAHNRPSPYLDPRTNEPTGSGVWEMATLWGMSIKEFWAPTNSQPFWANLPRTAEADAIVATALQKFGDKVAVLTAPSETPYCLPGKKQWMEKNFPILRHNMIFTSAGAKKFIGGPGRVLVDDKDTNVEEWQETGGIGILVPRPWNKLWRDSNNTKEIVVDELSRLSN